MRTRVSQAQTAVLPFRPVLVSQPQANAEAQAAAVALSRACSEAWHSLPEAVRQAHAKFLLAQAKAKRAG